MGRLARCLRGLARPGQFRRRRPAAPQPGQLPRRVWMKRNPAPSLALLSAITALAFCALHMVVPALPVLVQVFGDSPAHVQLVLSLYLGGIAAGQLIYGPVSDRFGRRPVLIAGLGLFLAGTVLCASAWSLAALIVGRLLQAPGAFAPPAPRPAGIPPAPDPAGAGRGLPPALFVI